MKIIYSFWISIILILFAISEASAQVVIKGQVIDQSTKKPLSRASVVLVGMNQREITDFDGKFSFYCEQCKKDRIKIMISFVGYGHQTFTFDLTNSNEIVIPLKRIDFPVAEVTVLPKEMKYLFFGSKETQVQDYLFVQDTWLIALYNFRTEKTFFVHLGKSKDILYEKKFVNNDFQNFYVSCLNRYYAETRNEAFEIKINNAKVEYDSVKFDYLNNTIKYYIGYSDPCFYFTQFKQHNLFQFFFIENTELKKISESPFAVVVRDNDLRQKTILKETNIYELPNPDIRMTRDKYSFNSPFYRPQKDLGWNSETKGEFMKEAFQTMFFKREFAPFYIIDSTIVLINYYQNFIQRNQLNGKRIDTITLKINNSGKRNLETFLDETTKKIYYRKEVDDSTQIHELNIANGESKKIRTVYRKNVTNVKIRNGFVYYLFNPPETNNVFLFREKLEE